MNELEIEDKVSVGYDSPVDKIGLHSVTISPKYVNASVYDAVDGDIFYPEKNGRDKDIWRSEEAIVFINNGFKFLREDSRKYFTKDDLSNKFINAGLEDRNK